MRRVLLILGLVAASALSAQTITNAEYFIGTDPGEGLATTISVSSPGAEVALSWIIPTASLAPNLYRVMVRVQTDAGTWSRPHALYLIVSPGNETPLLVTQFEWAVDNGAFTAVDVTDASVVSISQLVATASLAPGVLHRLFLRVSDGTGRTGAAHAGYFVLAPQNETPRLITQFEYAVDNDTPVVVDIEDASPATMSQALATAGLAQGVLHRVKFRVTDDLGRSGEFTNTLLPILPVDQASRTITGYEYWIDSNAPTSVDSPDAPVVNITEILATATVPVGLHFLNIRTTDDLGRTGKEHRMPFIVMSPYQNSVPRTIVAAEVFTGPDPGVGNGIEIPLPVDGAWDESGEECAHVFTGFDVGYYRVGFRTQDDAGRWSAADYDSLLVGPLLTAILSGTDIILNWEFPDNIDQYYIYRSPNTAGPFAVIDSTAARTYTDPGITTTLEKGFYYVTFRDDSISLQLPGGAKPTW